MRISPITNQYTYGANRHKRQSNRSFPSFGSKLSEIEKALNREGILTNFNGNEFVAECSLKITDVFKKLYGKLCLPKEIHFMPISMNPKYYGHFCSNDIIEFNSVSPCYMNMQTLK